MVNFPFVEFYARNGILDKMIYSFEKIILEEDYSDTIQEGLDSFAKYRQ